MNTPVRIKGVVYPTVASAARELGLSQTAIHNALDAGTLDTITDRVQRITYRGVEYPSKTALARHFGLTLQQTVYRLKKGIPLDAPKYKRKRK